jgi:hypothetical protein
MGRFPPAAFTFAMFAYVGVALAVEPHAGRTGELAIALLTWVILIAASRTLGRVDRARVAGVVLVASAGEVLGSLVLGLYAYRRGGIPAFVPPGHGLVYLAGLRLAQSALLRRHTRAAVRLALVGGAAWALLGLVAGPRPDVAGALVMLALVAFLLRGRTPLLYASMLLVVAVLELYGTAMGAWRWEPYWPGLDLPAGNPPSGVAAGYCLFDALALRLGPRLERAAARLVARTRSQAGRPQVPRSHATTTPTRIRTRSVMRPVLGRLARPAVAIVLACAAFGAVTGHAGAEEKPEQPDTSQPPPRCENKPGGESGSQPRKGGPVRHSTWPRF